MKKIFTIVTLSVLVWGCAKKIAAPAGSGIGSGTSSNGAISTTPPVPAGTPSGKSAAATPAGTVPATPAGSSSRSIPAADPAKASPEMQGQSTYNAKCGRCHGLKVTTDYTSDRWVSIMQVMASKANLTDAEKENVLVYVRANAKK